MSITKTVFGTLDGNDVFAYTMTNRNGALVTVLTYGGILNRLCLPDRDGRMADVLCGFDAVEDYIADCASYSGALIGRYCNRIADGRFALNGKTYTLDKNEDGVTHLHGGVRGFHQKLWQAETFEGEDEDRLVLSLLSPDGEEGYPGNLSVTVTYTFSSDSALTILYEGVSDKDTVMNMTSHAYFNLNGYDGGSAMEQELLLRADRYDVVDDRLIPIGESRSVAGTAFDFRTLRPIAQPYDHNFILNGRAGELREAAFLRDPQSGRTMTVYTDMPALQLYTATGMCGKTPFKGGVPQRALHAVCLETQYSPNTPNRPDLPSCRLAAGETYRSMTRFVFGIAES